jgi:hypothetical protein
VATLGMVLRVPGVDYESLDHSEQEYAVKRLEAAFKHFGPGFHVYHFLVGWLVGISSHRISKFQQANSETENFTCNLDYRNRAWKPA